MAKRFGDDTIIYNWIRNRNTVEFLGIWERIYNPDFKPVEFERFKNEAGFNRFNLSPKKWVDATNAIGIISKAGRYGGGTFAHKDIAFEFGSWLSAEFKLYLIKEFQRHKEDEQKRLSLEWNLQRTLAKINYRIHTDAVKENLPFGQKLYRIFRRPRPPPEAERRVNIISWLLKKSYYRLSFQAGRSTECMPMKRICLMPRFST